MEMSLNTTRRLVFIRGFDFGRVGLIKSPAPPTLVFLVCSPVEVASPRLCPQPSTICLPLTGNTLGDVLLADLGEGGAAGEPGCRWGSGGVGEPQCSEASEGRRPKQLDQTNETPSARSGSSSLSEPANQLFASEMVLIRDLRAL